MNLFSMFDLKLQQQECLDGLLEKTIAKSESLRGLASQGNTEEVIAQAKAYRKEVFEIGKRVGYYAYFIREPESLPDPKFTGRWFDTILTRMNEERDRLVLQRSAAVGAISAVAAAIAAVASSLAAFAAIVALLMK